MDSTTPPGMDLDKLYEYLKRFRLSDSLFIIGALSAALKAGFETLYLDGVPEQAIQWIETMCKDRHARVELAIHLSRLARLLLLSSSNDYKREVLDFGNGNLQNTINSVSVLHEPEIDTPKSVEDLKRMMGRISQWQFPHQRSRVTIIGRGQMLFLDIPNEIKSTYDFNVKAIEYLGIDVFQFIATGFALWAVVNGVLKYNLTIEIDALKSVVTPESVKKFMAVSCGTREEYARYVRGENWQTKNALADMYGFDPFALMPAIKVENASNFLPEDTYVVPQPLFLLQRASMGLFYLLGDKERDIGAALGQPVRNDFRQSFGDVYRECVGKHLALAIAPAQFIDLDKDISIKGEKPDFALIEGDTCVLFEVKTGLLTLDARTFFDKAKTRAEVQDGNFKKAVGQLNSFGKAIIEGSVKDKRFDGVSKVVKVIVGFEDIFLANAVLLPLLREKYGDSEIADFQIATITDIEHMGTMLSQGGSLAALLREKVETPEKVEDTLAPVIHAKSPDGTKENPLLEKAFDAFGQRLGGTPLRR